MRKRRVGEVVCNCFAYPFAHRMLGGRCGGGAFVQTQFENQMWGECRDCIFRVQLDDGSIECQVLGGLDKLTYCPALIEFIDYHEIKLYGARGPNRHNNL